MEKVYHPAFGWLTDEEDIRVYERQQEQAEYEKQMQKEYEEMMTKEYMDMEEKAYFESITPFTDTEKECLNAHCPNFVVWSYWGQELHSCKLQGESDNIVNCADCEECPINKK